MTKMMMSAVTVLGMFTAGLTWAQEVAVPPPIRSTALLGPKKASDIKTVQASHYFREDCPVGGFKLNRLVVPPTVYDFQIPPGYVYVVTSMEWSAHTSSIDEYVGLEILVETAWGVNGPAARDAALSDRKGRVASTATFPTGIVVRSNQFLCIAIEGQNAEYTFEAVAHGYLALDQ